MNTKYLSPLAALTLTALVGCTTTNPQSSNNFKPAFIKTTNGVEAFVGTKEQVENFANTHNLNVYDLPNNQVYAEGVTMSRHRYEATTNPVLIDGNALNGVTNLPKEYKAIKRKE